MDYKNIITQEIQAFLMSEDVEVTTVEHKDDPSIPEDMLKFAILVGNGKKGGLHFSADINKMDIQTTLQLCFRILHAQLIIYAIDCIKQGHRGTIAMPFVPDFKETVLFNNVAEAQAHYNSLSSTVASFSVFENSYFNKKTKLKTTNGK
jgi:hypothetical protein